MKKLIALLLCLTILTMPVMVFAESVQPVQPFGSDIVPLSQEEMEEIDGEWQGVAIAGAVGASVGYVKYLASTPREDWNVRDAAREAAFGAVEFIAGGLLGSLF